MAIQRRIGIARRIEGGRFEDHERRDSELWNGYGEGSENKRQ